jgi:hypothetical protein
MRRRLFFGAGVAVLSVGLMPGGAHALTQSGQSQAPVVVTLNSGIGTRVVSDAGSTLTLVPGSGLTTASANYSIAVAEVAVTGANPWTVTGQLFDTQSTPVANQVGQVATPTNTITGSAFSVSSNAPSPLTSSASSTPHAGTGGTLSAALTLFSVNESTSAVYTNTWTGGGTVTLTPPNGTVSGGYAGTFVETLFQ